MARVTITVECEGGSVITVDERSAYPLHTDDQTVLLVQQAFIRTCRALGVREESRPEPDPGGASSHAPTEVAAVPASREKPVKEAA